MAAFVGYSIKRPRRGGCSSRLLKITLKIFTIFIDSLHWRQVSPRSNTTVEPQKYGHKVNHQLPGYELQLHHFVVHNFHCREVFLCSKLTSLLYRMFDYLSSVLIFRYHLSRCEQCSRKRSSMEYSKLIPRA